MSLLLLFRKTSNAWTVPQTDNAVPTDASPLIEHSIALSFTDNSGTTDSGGGYGDSFTGTDGASWDASKWTKGATSGAGAATIDTNRGKQVTTALGSYNDYQAEILSVAGQFTNGQVTGTVMVPALGECYACLEFRSATGSSKTGNCYFLAFEPSVPDVQFYKVVSGTMTGMGTASFTFVANTVYQFELNFNGSTFDIRIWTGTRPGTPTLTSSGDTAITGPGWFSLDMGGGAPTTARTVYWDDIVVTPAGSSPSLAVIQLTHTVTSTDDSGSVDTPKYGISQVEQDDSGSTDQPAYTLSPKPSDNTWPTDSIQVDKSQTVTQTDNSVPTDTPAYLFGPAPLDSAGVTDPPAFTLSPAAVDLAGATDPVAWSTSTAPTDLAWPTDTTLVGKISAVTQTDLAAPTDAATLAFGPGPTDLAWPTDAAAYLFGPAPLDSAGVTDPPAFTLSPAAVDLAGATDPVAWSTSTAPTDLAWPTDTANVVATVPQAWTVTQTDDTGTVDAPAATQSPTISDNAWPTDPVGVARGSVAADNAAPTDGTVLDRGTAALDPTGPVDTWTLARVLGPVDGGNPTDTPVFALQSATVDSSGLADTAAVGFIVGLTFTDSAGVTDAPSLAPALFYADNTNPTDSITVSGSVGGIVDNANPTDAAAFTTVRQIAGQDVAWPTDQAALSRGLPQTDDSGLADTVAVVPGLRPVDQAGVTDPAAFTRGTAVADQAGATDPYTIAQFPRVIALDETWLLDQAVIGHGINLTVTDGGTLTEYWPSIDRVQAPTDDAGVTDRTLFTPGRVEEAGLVDSFTQSAAHLYGDDTGAADSTSMSGTIRPTPTDNAGSTDTPTLDRSSTATDNAASTDSAAVLKYKDVTQVDQAGPTDGQVWAAGLAVADAVDVRDPAGFDRKLVVTEAWAGTDTGTYDRGVGLTDQTGTTDTAPRALGRPVVDPASGGDQAFIVLQVRPAWTDGTGLADGVVIAVGHRLTFVDQAGATEVTAVTSPLLRDILVTATLAPQTRLTASLDVQQRIAAVLGIQPARVAQIAAQNRIDVVLALPPRVTATLKEQPR